MARARNIKPGFFKNEILGVADPLYSLLFEGLWVLADREGRLEDRPVRIKGELFPYRDGLNVDSMLDWLQDNEFIARFKVGQARFIQVLNFKKHQAPHVKEAASTIPAPDEPGASPVQALDKHAPSPEPAHLIPDSLIPDCGLSDSGLLIADPPKKSSSTALDARRTKAPPNEANRETWAAYERAYATRYSVPPVRNAKVNGMVARLVERLGAEAPDVASHYLSNNSQFYVQSAHCVDLLLRDAEKLRTEWATGRRTTNGQARQLDSTQTNYNVFSKIIEEQKVTTQ